MKHLTPKDIDIVNLPARMGDEMHCTIVIHEQFGSERIDIFYGKQSDEWLRTGQGGNCEVDMTRGLTQTPKSERNVTVATFVAAMLQAGIDIDTVQFRWALLNVLDLLGR